MFTQKHTSQQRTAVKGRPLLKRTEDLLARVRKDPKSFDWEEWRSLLQEVGKLSIKKTASGDVIISGKSAEYLVKALALYLIDYVRENNALPAGFLQLPEKDAIIEWIKATPEISDEDKQHIDTLYLPSL